MRTKVLWLATALAAGLVGWLWASAPPLPAQGGPGTPPADAPPAAASLPLTSIVLYSSGVGYFQREGEVTGNARVDFAFPVGDVNDLLKSLVLQDLGGGKVAAVSYDSSDPIEKSLKSFALDLTQNPPFADLLNQARGEKLEVTTSPASNQPGTFSGTIVGVETQKQPAGKEGTVDVALLNLFTAEGVRSLPLGQVQRVKFLRPALEAEFQRALETLAKGHDTRKKTVSLNFAGEGKRAVRVGYVVESPIWKTSYRLVFKDGNAALLQGWAVVENTTDDDWTNVRMNLVAGRPISFKMDLYNPLFVPRPTVEPELFASLRPPTYGGAMGADRRPGRQRAPEVTNLSIKLAPTEVAYTVGVNPITGGGGHIKIGDRVDVLGMIASTDPSEPPAYGVVLENIEVMIHGTFTRNQPNEPIQPDRFTLRIKRDQAQVLMAAEQLGPIKLALRPGGVSSTFNTPQNKPRAGRRSTDIQEQVEAKLNVMDPTQGVASVASAEEVGDFYQYAIEQKVTLARQKSALLPIVNKDVEAKKVSIFSEAVHAKYPLLGLRLKNISGMHLMQGPITLFEGGSYSGDARILDLRPNEERLLSYAMDLGMEVKAEAKSEPERMTAIKVVKGVLHATQKQQRQRSYLVQNRADAARTLLIEHPIEPDWTLITPKEPAEKSRDVYRFQLEVPAGQSARQEVVEERVGRTEISVLEPNEGGLAYYAHSTAASPQVKAALEKAITLRQKLSASQRELAEVERQQQALSNDQARLRANLKEAPATSAAYQRYLKKFDAQESEVETLQAEEKRLRAAAERDLAVLQDFVGGLSAE